MRTVLCVALGAVLGVVAAQLTLRVFAAEPAAPKFDEPSFVAFGPRASWVDAGKDPMYADYVNRFDRANYDKKFDSRYTAAHEATHQINAAIRNRVNAFYVGGGRAALVDEPGFELARVRRFVPESLEGFRYQLYLVSQAEGPWNERPLYVFDEWTAYLNECLLALDDARKAEPTTARRTDIFRSALEFAVYGAAVGRAAKKLDPKYWEENKQFRDFLRWQVVRTFEAWHASRRHPGLQFTDDQAYYDTLKRSEDAAPIRNFLAKDLGLDLQSLLK